ncbi:MAG: Gfo/Idh/MocA family oxidoreductase [Opitutaceae bacterium]
MKNVNRRSFLKTSAATAAGAFILPRFSIGKPGVSANSKANIAMIGAGGIASMAYGELKNENIVALCDIDSRQFGQHSKKYPQITKAETFADFRVMLDRMGKDIDGVCVNTPDHTHFVATIDTMQRGIHVCTQKPLTHNIWQARTLKRAKDKYGVITNMANQGHTYDGIRQMREWYEAGVFGQIEEVHMGFPGPDWQPGRRGYFGKPDSMPPKGESIPREVEWDLWKGPSTTDMPYNRLFHPVKWRGFNEFGTGQFGDWFCHIGDGPVWVLDLFDPVVIECVERGPAMEGMIPDHSVVRFDFPARGKHKACSVYWYDGMNNGGTAIKTPDDWDLGKLPDKGSYWYGEKQSGFLDERSNNPRLTTRQGMKDFNKGADIPQTYERVKQNGPFAEWVAAIKGDVKECGSNFDYSAPMTETALLGVLAQRFGGRIEWDPEKGVTNRPELNAFVKEPVRSGWEYGEDLWKA